MYPTRSLYPVNSVPAGEWQSAYAELLEVEFPQEENGYTAIEH